MSLSEFSTKLTLRGYPVTKSAISLWITDKRTPKIKTREYREALANALEMPVNELLSVFGYEVTDETRSSEAMYAADLVDHMDSEKRKLAIGILEKIAGN